MRFTTSIAIAAALASAGPAGAHERIDGDGNTTTRQRHVGAFTAVTLETVADVSVKVGGSQSVAVTTDSNLQEHVETRIEGKTLVITSRSEIRPTRRPRVEVSVPELRAVTLGGAGEMTVEGGKGELALLIDGAGDLRWTGEATALKARIHGSGDLVLRGRADTLQAYIDGSGDIDGSALTARSAEARVNGSGDIDVRLDGGTLAAAVNGSGDIRWSGKASVESAAVSGSGEIARRE